MKVRVPAILREVSALNPDYSSAVHGAIDGLARQLEDNALIPMCDTTPPAADDWADAHSQRAGETWGGTDWFYAETFIYRHLMDAINWWTTRRDPFAPKKREEEMSPALWGTLEQALSLDPEPMDAKLRDLLALDLWGNRVDLSYMIGTTFTQTADDWAADEREAVVSHLLAGDGTGSVHLITDNYGTELATDLALIDGLLDGVVERVVMHVKAHPTYVSDATQSDVMDFIALLSEDRRPIFSALADRLNAARIDGRLIIQPDFFWNSSRFLFDMSPSIRQTLSSAALIIVKGDANYRRITGDTLYPTTTPFAEVLSYAPAPLCALRTFKSDPVIGLQPGQAEGYQQIDPEWRINGRRGVIQFKP
jgi:uncharacterized protein with ATP-grasp and redox domains